MESVRSLKSIALEFYHKHGTVAVLIIITTLGLALYVFGHFHLPPPVDDTTGLVWYAKISIELGRIILVGAVLGAFVRFLHTFKAIREVVTDVFFGDEILKRRKDLEEIWAKLSKHIFIPDFSNDNGLSANLQDKIVEQLREGMRHNKTFYVRSSDRTITVKWVDSSNSIVEIVDKSIEEFIPFQKGGKVHWEHVFSAGNGAKSEDYSPTFKVEIDGIDIKPKQEPKSSNENLTYSYTMEGKNLYKVVKRSSRSWDIRKDPLIVFVSNHIVESLRLEINCLSDDIKPFFEEHHLKNKFFVQYNEAQEQRPSDYVTLCTSPILPGDGFTIGLIKI